MAKKKKGTLKYIIIGAVVLLILVVIAGKMGWIGGPKKELIATEKAEKRTVQETVSASGKVQPEKEVKLSSEVSGEIVELNVKEGEVVTKGQILCRIKPDILQSGYDKAVASLNSQRAALASAQQQLKQSEASLNIMEATFKRTQQLYNRKVISAAEFDKARTDYESALASVEAQRQNVIGSRYGIDQSQAAVKEAGDNLARTTIYAPVDGVISWLGAEQGERVVGTAQMAGTEIMRIANMSSMEVNVDVNESDINRVSLNNEATIEIDAFRGRKFKGIVTEIASSSSANALSSSSTTTTSNTDQVTNFTVKVRILPESYEDLLKPNRPNPSPFRPGLSATVDILTEKDTGLAVPIQAVTTREDATAKKDSTANDAKKDDGFKSNVKEYVFVYDPATTKVKQVEVTTGIQDDAYIRILSGLKEGQEVVIRPFNAISKTLKDGDLVEKTTKDKVN
ncbi:MULTISPECIES: efflux RND transporter periplasmic adaptor subunit [Olivibacter]|uniref:Efflux transporter, RND family, MFP subunit n=3 Tax=Sphingobacteriaceae TaxID=84566 RepID=F4CAA4_SPHS2|nr:MULTISPECIES: efflux RND transporter periplasmic adaptor subunit [Olivibacter]MCL4637864.1 efflux RND transporter periplasmic adaptor subunit [Olivibacter sp. UJ_SKK_5.1]MDX3914470.1 efflux RND transporter periplasmic adaptor subunit [Pseudosphingobacterium sp.]QEL02590.1 efflux RND transporter periplasmic adaptor subunit [Olivibacter sp. LS-1]